jgi:diguanylate cyclase (GGDEF)-like protein
MMKTLLFLLGDSQAPMLKELAPRISRLAPAHVEVQPVSAVQDLQAQLPETPCNTIIINTGSPDSLSGLVSECRDLVPHCGMVTLLENVSAYPKAFWGQDVHCITSSTDEFSLAAAISSAEQESALRIRLLSGNRQDEVENLLSRPYFMHRLSEEISIARRHKAPLCCVIISLNYYRMYLDSYGYQFTNALLAFAGDQINKLIRYEDQVARVGDDELGLLLSHCSEANAKSLIQRVTATLNSLQFQFGQYQEDLSVCAGVAAFPFPDGTPASPDKLVRYAHHALHQAKTSDDETVFVSTFSEIKPKL